MDAQLLLEFRADINAVDANGIALLGLVSNPRLITPLVSAWARIEVPLPALPLSAR